MFGIQNLLTAAATMAVSLLAACGNNVNVLLLHCIAGLQLLHGQLLSDEPKVVTSHTVTIVLDDTITTSAPSDDHHLKTASLVTTTLFLRLTSFMDLTLRHTRKAMAR